MQDIRPTSSITEKNLLKLMKLHQGKLGFSFPFTIHEHRIHNELL